jgi:4-amino-4-deoxy-L-arabinose transferase-like glycosyltransferase
MSSHLDSGFRYALPVLPLLAILGAAGIARLWARGRRVRGTVAVLLACQVAAVGVAYPRLLAFASVWAGDRDRAYPALLDSSVDWGQGLLDLRRFMAEEGVARVSLSYFGSAMPEAYGIDYAPLPSFFRLEGGSDRGPAPRFTVLSATTLHGLYLQGHDPFASYRSRQPYKVLGHILFIYDDGGGSTGGASSGP